MVNLRLLALLFVLALVSFEFVPATIAQEQPKPKTTTFIVVRHADRDGKKDALTAEGHARAGQLKEIASLLRVKHIYSTDWVRTKSTAKPSATKLGLKINLYKRLDEKSLESLKAKYAGEVVMIVGHSNTVGPIATRLGFQGDASVGDDDFDDLFVVRTQEKTSRGLRLKYGD